MDPSSNPSESSSQTTTQTTRRQRQVRLIPEINLNPTTPSNPPPINSNPPSRSESHLYMGETKENMNEIQKTQAYRHRRTDIPSRGRNLTSSMQEGEYFEMRQRYITARKINNWNGPSSDDIQKCTKTGTPCVFQQYTGLSLAGFNPSLLSFGRNQCGCHHDNVLLHNFGLLLYKKPVNSTNTNSFACGFREYKEVFGERFEKYEASIRELMTENPIGQALVRKYKGPVGTVSDHIASRNLQEAEERAYQETRDRIEHVLFVWMERRACSLPQLVTALRYLNSHTSTAVMEVLSAKNDTVHRGTAYRICAEIAKQHPALIVRYLLKYFIKQGRLLNIPFDNYQIMNLAQGLAFRMPSTSELDAQGQHFAMTLIDALFRFAEHPEDLVSTIQTSTKRTSTLKTCLVNLTMYVDRLTKSLITNADTTREDATLACISLRTFNKDELDGTAPIELGDADPEEVDSENNEEEEEEDDEGRTRNVYDISTGGFVLINYESGDDDSGDEVGETNDNTTETNDMEEDEHATAIEAAENWRKRWTLLRPGQIVELQLFNDFTYYKILLMDLIEENVDDEYPDKHWVVQWIDAEEMDVLFERDNYRLIGEDKIPPKPDYSCILKSLSAKERKDIKDDECNKYYEMFHEMGAKRTSGKINDHKNIVGMYAVFRSASKINEVAITIMEFFLLYAAGDPELLRMLMFTCDAETFNFMLHILYRMKLLYPDLDLGFVFVMPELWHTCQAALLSILDDRTKGGDKKDLTSARWGLKWKTFSQLHLIAGCFHEAWLKIRSEFLHMYPVAKISDNVDLQSLVTGLDYSLNVVLSFLKDLTSNPKLAFAALRDILVVLRMNNATTYTAIMTKTYAHLEMLKEQEPAYYNYIVSSFNACVGVPIELQHKDLAGMQSSQASVKTEGFTSPDSMISRIQLMNETKSFLKQRYIQIKDVDEYYELSLYSSSRYEQHRLYCEHIIWVVADACQRYKKMNLNASESNVNSSQLLEPLVPHCIEFNLKNYVTQSIDDLGFAITKSSYSIITTTFKTFTTDDFHASDVFDGRKDGWVFKNGPLGVGYYVNAGQQCEITMDITKGEEIDVSGIVDGIYQMVVVVEGNVNTYEVTVVNETITSCPIDIKVDESITSFVWNMDENDDAVIDSFDGVVTLSFYFSGFKDGFECDNISSRENLMFGVVTVGPFGRQKMGRVKELSKLRVGDQLTHLNGRVIECGEDAMNVILEAYATERATTKNVIILKFQTDRPLVNGLYINSNTLGIYRATCTFVLDGRLSKEHLEKLAHSAHAFDAKFGEECTHPRQGKLDRAIHWYYKTLENIKRYGRLPSKQDGESAMYREAITILLDSLDERWDCQQYRRTKTAEAVAAEAVAAEAAAVEATEDMEVDIENIEVSEIEIEGEDVLMQNVNDT